MATSSNAPRDEPQDRSALEPERKPSRYRRLHQAALSGDWATAKCIFDKHSADICANISKEKDTALHIAVAAEQKEFVRKLVKLMTEYDRPLDEKNKDENTALCVAAVSGNVEIAKMMLMKDEDLTSIRGKEKLLPIHMAAMLGHKDMVRYLYQFTICDLEAAECIDLLSYMIDFDLYDLAFSFLRTHRHLVTNPGKNIKTALLALARKPTWLPKSQPKIWMECVTVCFKTNFCGTSMPKSAHQLLEQLVELVMQLSDDEIPEVLRQPLFTAAALGNMEFLIILVRSYPDLIWECDDNNGYLFHVAVKHRHERIFNLIHELGANKHLIAVAKDKRERSLLDLAARLPPPNRLQTVSGAALQMQRELLWFEAVKKIVPQSYCKVPRQVFSGTHNALRKEGQEWMKNTANSCMLVAALIATVVFAAGFTVPGGNNSETGAPILLRKTSFTVFMVSDAIALCSSSTSIMIFLSILTSRYAEQDFRFWLPLKLMLGLLSLFFSIIAMLVAFSVTIFLIYNRRYGWIRILIVVLASVTGISFAISHASLLLDTISAIFSSVFLFRPSRHKLYRKPCKYVYVCSNQ